MWSRMSPNVIDWKLDLLGKGKGLLQGRCSRLDRSCATLPWTPAPRALAHIPPIHPHCFCRETRSKTLHLVLFIQTLAMMTEFYHILISSSGARPIPARTRTQQTLKWWEHDRTLSNLACFLLLIPSKRMLSLVVDGMRRRKQFRYEWLWNFTKPLLWWPNRIASSSQARARNSYAHMNLTDTPHMIRVTSKFELLRTRLPCLLLFLSFPPSQSINIEGCWLPFSSFLLVIPST